jgi:hypothetical protein
MNELLESRTFNQTFSNGRKHDKSVLKEVIFVIMRQMSEKFDEMTPDS